MNENIDETESAADGLGLDRRRLAGSGKVKQKINNLTISHQLSNGLQLHERNASADQSESPSKQIVSAQKLTFYPARKNAADFDSVPEAASYGTQSKALVMRGGDIDDSAEDATQTYIEEEGASRGHSIMQSFEVETTQALKSKSMKVVQGHKNLLRKDSTKHQVSDSGRDIQEE